MTVSTTSEQTLTFDMLLEESMSSPELISQTAIKYNEEPTPDSTFSYAFALCYSSEQNERVYGMQLFDQLIASKYPYLVDCFYAKAVAEYLNGDYAGSRKTVEAILRSNPDNEKAKELHQATISVLEDKERRENIMIGTGALAVGVGVVVGIAGLLLGKPKR
mmetsp:Transcript_8506/g.17058  ORF Transcript_8506/g.17058 Transcript_8506/m.17058 type:complete len:162 (-) Transcript_8506:55-540(-)|eukprot:CAMPEP_0182454312 /NCGR_PEP_ID=MMETSP1319-20130603/1006_1 /TAXON_ID=172717 /ORGANISM="Bolidomonas pacifica, Strain RCC208" /LENGTH=161 /DNA_ID=CAMNT_0024652317 /DNA_START=204 /DNA_END=689 /DNA_ORIENTATION=-